MKFYYHFDKLNTLKF